MSEAQTTTLEDVAYGNISGDLYHFHVDYINRPYMVSNTTVIGQPGDILWYADYYPFGGVMTEIGSIAIGDPSTTGFYWQPPFRFPGQYEDEETGLFYNWNRYYIPELGRYNRLDPAGASFDFDLYIYSKNNSVLFYDPKGLKCAKICKTPKYCAWYDVEVGDLIDYGDWGGHVALVFGFTPDDYIMVAENIGAGPKITQWPYVGPPEQICAHPRFSNPGLQLMMLYSGVKHYSTEQQDADSDTQDCAGYVSRVYELLGVPEMRYRNNHYLNHEDLAARFCINKRKKCCESRK